MFEIIVTFFIFILLVLLAIAQRLRFAILLLWFLVNAFGFVFLFFGADILMVHFWFVGTLMCLMIYLHSTLLGDETSEGYTKKNDNILLIPYGVAGGVFIFLVGWLLNVTVQKNPSQDNVLSKGLVTSGGRILREGIDLGEALVLQHGVLTVVFVVVILLTLVGLAEERKST